MGTGDDSFEHTLKCLWDSCSASLPLLQVQSADGASTSNGTTSCLQHDGHMLSGMNSNTASSAGGALLPTNCGAPSSHSMQTQPSLPLQDAPTATLVRHLLQDHLHIPSDVLSLLSPSLGVSNTLLNTANNGLTQAALPQSQDLKPSFHSALPPASSLGMDYADNSQRQASFPQSLPHHHPHTNSPNLSHHSRPPSVASGSNCNSPAFPNFTQQSYSHLNGNGKGHSVDNDMMAKHARNASLDSLASSVLEVSYGLPQQQHQSWNSHSHSRNASMSELYNGPATKVSSDSAVAEGGNQVHTCGWEDCGGSFSSTSALMEHISSAHIGSGKSIYYCHWVGCERALSGRGFNQRQKIQRHLRTHVGDKPFVCPFPGCPSKFSESTTLNQHIRTQHTSDKPFKCDFEGCGKSFALQSALTIHKRTHSGEKPFKCPVEGCGMRFAESSNLSKHVKTHRTNGEYAEGEGQRERKQRRKRKGTVIDDDDGDGEGEEEGENDGVSVSFSPPEHGSFAGKNSRRQRSRV